MTETTREKYEQLSRWLRETGAPSREWDRLTALYRDAGRLAKLEDGIRALADQWEKDANSLRNGKTVQAHAEADTLQDCAGFARALLEGECQACAKERSGVVSGGTPHTCLLDGE